MGCQIMKTLELHSFYPEEMDVAQIIEKGDEIQLKVFVRSKSCRCPKCGAESMHHHGTYIRKLQDLPILGKTTKLLVNSYEYQCDNPMCQTTTFADNLEGFLNYYSRMTDRCTDFVCTLALETSCEGAARICNKVGVKVSGDTIIRILKKRFDELPVEATEDCIGIDDFSIKKGNKYCTIICNGNSHTPIAVLEGRDGTALKEWLKNNKHVRCVTRDRASAYAKVLSEELPDVMQVADRFHLHQNLLDAIKKALSSGCIPQTVKVVRETDTVQHEESAEAFTDTEGETGKKNRSHCG